jgi:hypothetical protein
MQASLRFTGSLLLAGVLAAPTFAQVALDDDNASRTVYDDGIQNFDNGSTTGAGTGFGGWVFGGNVVAGSDFIVSSGSTNGGSGDIDVSGEAFLLTDADGGGEYTDVFRFLDGGDLGEGQTFSIDLDVNFRGGFKGIRVRDTDDSTAIFRFEVGNPGSGDDYIVYDAATNNGSIGNSYSNDSIFTISLEQTSLGGGTWSITRSGGISDFDTGTYSGQLSSFQLYTTGAGSSNEQALVANNLSIIPEPGTLFLFGLGGIALLALRRRI